MNIKKTGLIIGSCLAFLYLLYLGIPFCLTGLVNSYVPKIESLVEKSSGFKLSIENARLLTTPKLTAGVGAGKIKLNSPAGDEVLAAENAQVKVSLLPLLIGRVELDVIRAKDASLSLKVKPDGSLLIADYFSDNGSAEVSSEAPMCALPFGLKLSNRLPDIRVDKYSVAVVDSKTSKVYSVNGSELKVTDFVINKKVKISTNGSVTLAGDVPFKYDVKVFNKVMPDVTLDDLVFAQPAAKTEKAAPLAFNIIDIFENIRKNQLRANLTTDVKSYGKLDDIHVDGLVDVENLSLAIDGKPLPEGHVKLTFKGKKAVSDIALYSGDNETTTVISEYSGGKSKKINLAVKSNAKINNIFNIIKVIASTFNYNDLDTLSATGAIDTDFKLKSDMKKVYSSGYFKIPEGSIKYALYNVLINNIKADIDFSGDSVNLKNFGFTILNQPLKAYGTIKHDSTIDLHLLADKLMIRGLLVATGQVGLLKDNDVKSGTLSLDASVKGKLKEVVPVVNLVVNNLNILNKPSETTLKMAGSNVNISTDGKSYKGNVNANSINIINPMLKFALPKVALSLNEKDLNIADTYLMFDNSRIDISGKVSDYANKNIAISLKAKGALKASDLKNTLPAEYRSMVTASGSLPVYVSITGNDKKQIVDAQVLATPGNYLHIADLAAISGKNSLWRSNVVLDGNVVKLSDTGLYVYGKNTIDESGSVSGLTQLLRVAGDVDISSLTLKDLKVATLNTQTVSIPGFKNSKAIGNVNISLHGNAANPSITGQADLSQVSLPTMKTELQNVAVDMGANAINVNLPKIKVDNSTMNAKLVINPNFANGIIIKSVDFNGDYIDSDTLAAALAGGGGSASSVGTSSASKSSAPADLGIVIQSGKGTVTKFKSGSIIATNLLADFLLKNNIFYLKNLKGDAFGGKISGDVNCNVISGATNVNMSGTGMSAVSAIEGAAGIKNALSGVLDFTAKLSLNAFAKDYNSMLKSVKGDVSFDVKDGHYANIGSLDHLLLAQNIAANVILKAAIAPIRNLPVVQNASNFKTINGSLTLKNGIAYLKSIKSTGPSMAYYVTGQYNLISGYTNVVILGRLGADVVAALGPLGELSASKLTSYIPKFGTKTSAILSALTSNPKSENISSIPALSSGNTNAKDFKVLYVGTVTNPSSIKSFKWLSTCDTSAITGGTIKEQLKTTTDAIKTSGKNTVSDVKTSVENVKESAKDVATNIKDQVQKTKDSIQDLKNLKNMFKKPAATTETGVAE